MAATCCSVFVFERVHCKPSPASCMDVVADMVAGRRYLSERLIFSPAQRTNIAAGERAGPSQE